MARSRGVSCLWAVALAAAFAGPTAAETRDAAVERQLQGIKRSNPALYQSMMAGQGNAAERRKIVDDFRAGRLSKSAASARIRPFAVLQAEQDLEQVDGRIAGLEKGLDFLERSDAESDKHVRQRIAQLKAELEDLKKVSESPEILVQRHIEALLGKK
jgi:hypothetical protein